jgi:hypothetical protein
MRHLLAFLLVLSAALAAGDAPEIAVSRNGSAVPDGGSETIYGTILTQAFSQTWTIANEGAAALTLGAPVIGSLTNCTVAVTTAPAASVAANGSTTMVLQITPTLAGAWSFTVSLATDDANENPMNWTVAGSADASATVEVSMSRSGADVADASTDTIAGSTALVEETLTYTILNQGSAQLNLSASQLGIPSNATASIIISPDATVAPGGTTRLVVTVRPTVSGAWSVPAQFSTNDGNEDPYNWTIGGNAVAVGPEAALSRSGAAIADGAVYNGPGGTAGSAMDLTFTMANVGTGVGTMTVASPVIGTRTNCAAQVQLSPSSPLSGGASTTFTIRVTPDTNATWTAAISVATNDTTEASYDFTIRGVASAGGSSGGGDEDVGGGGCGAGAVGGLIIALSLFGLRRRRC